MQMVERPGHFGEMMARGKFISFEGGDGSGKSTQIAKLADYLVDRKIPLLTTREPGGTVKAEALRQFLLSGAGALLGVGGEAILFNAARIDHLEKKIEPSLTRGIWVLCDRFADSTRAYQGAKHRDGLADGILRALELVTLQGIKPDVTFLLDLPPEVGLTRTQLRRGRETADRFERLDVSFHHALRQKYLSMAAEEPERWIRIDASQNAMDMAKQIRALVVERFSIEAP